MVDNHQPIGRQSSTVWFIIINHTADNYRPLKCNGCLNEENGVTVGNEVITLTSEDKDKTAVLQENFAFFKTITGLF